MAYISISLVSTSLRTVFLEKWGRAIKSWLIIWATTQYQHGKQRESPAASGTLGEVDVGEQPCKEALCFQCKDCHLFKLQGSHPLSQPHRVIPPLRHLNMQCQALPCPIPKPYLLNSGLLLLNLTIYKLSWTVSTQKLMRITAIWALLIKITPLAVSLALKPYRAFCESGKIIYVTSSLGQGVKLPN